MYPETLAHILEIDRPNDDVRLADPQALSLVASSFRPHLIALTSGSLHTTIGPAANRLANPCQNCS